MVIPLGDRKIYFHTTVMEETALEIISFIQKNLKDFFISNFSSTTTFVAYQKDFQWHIYKKGDVAGEGGFAVVHELQENKRLQHTLMPLSTCSTLRKASLVIDQIPTPTQSLVIRLPKKKIINHDDRNISWLTNQKWYADVFASIIICDDWGINISTKGIPLHKYSFVPNKRTTQMILQKLSALLCTLHANGLSYTDFKPQNIIVFPENSSFELRLVDYGSLRQFKIVNGSKLPYQSYSETPGYYHIKRVNKGSAIHEIFSNMYAVAKIVEGLAIDLPDGVYTIKQTSLLDFPIATLLAEIIYYPPTNLVAETLSRYSAAFSGYTLPEFIFHKQPRGSSHNL